MTDTLDLTPAAIWLRAADVLDERGWAQDHYVDPAAPCYGPVCALGAIAVAAGYQPDAWVTPFGEDLAPIRAAADGLVVFLALELPDKHPDSLIQVIGDWNDANDQTITEVTAALRAAAGEASS